MNSSNELLDNCPLPKKIKVENILVNEDLCLNEEIDNSSSSNVWKDLFLFCYIQFSI